MPPEFPVCAGATTTRGTPVAAPDVRSGIRDDADQQPVVSQEHISRCGVGPGPAREQRGVAQGWDQSARLDPQGLRIRP